MYNADIFCFTCISLYYLSIGCECPDEAVVVVEEAVITLGCTRQAGLATSGARCLVLAWPSG